MDPFISFGHDFFGSVYFVDYIHCIIMIGRLLRCNFMEGGGGGGFLKTCGYIIDECVTNDFPMIFYVLLSTVDQYTSFLYVI